MSPSSFKPKGSAAAEQKHQYRQKENVLCHVEDGQIHSSSPPHIVNNQS